MTQKITPLRAVGIAVALLWPFALRPLMPLLSAPLAALRDVVVLLVLFFIMNRERISLRDIGLHWPSWKDALWGAALGAAAVLLAVAVQLVVPPQPSTQVQSALSSVNWITGIPLFIVVGLTEELASRGYLIGVASSNVGKPIAFAVSTIVFALGHTPSYGLNASLLSPLACGALQAGFYLWRRNLTACVIGHALSDYVSLAL